MNYEEYQQKWRSNEGLRHGLHQIIESDLFRDAVNYWKAKMEKDKMAIGDNAAPTIVDRMFASETGALKFLRHLEEITHAPKPAPANPIEWAHENPDNEKPKP